MSNILLFGYYARFLRPLLPVARELGGTTVIYMPHIDKPNSPVSKSIQNIELPKGVASWAKIVGEPWEDYDPATLVSAVSEYDIDAVIMSDVVWEPCHRVRSDLRKAGLSTPVIGRPHGLPFDCDVGYIRHESQDRLACWGGYQKRLLNRLGILNVDLVGNPEYDSLWNTWQGGRYILFCAESSDKNVVLRMLEEVRTALPGYPILIKEHPELPGEWCRFLGTQAGFDFPKEEYEADVYKLIQQSALTLTVSSTCGIDAMVIGAPSLFLGSLTWKSATVWKASGLVANEGEVGQKAQWVVDTHYRDMGYLYDLVTGPGATDRMVKVIAKCVDSVT